MHWKNVRIILILTIFTFIISLNEESMIIFPFKIVGLSSLGDVEEKNEKQSYNGIKFFYDQYSFRMFSPVKLGSPPQDIIAFINFNYNYLLIGKLLEIPQKIYPNSFYKGYKYDKSYSFINITSINNTKKINSKNFICNEKLYLFSKIKDLEENIYTSFPNFEFTIEKNIRFDYNSIYGLIIGLQLKDDKNYETNLLNQINTKNIISSNIISFEFKNENEGILILGKYPHEYMPKKYKKENFKMIYSYRLKDSYLTNFAINFEEIYSSINKEKYLIQKFAKGYLFINIGLIIGISEYKNFIEKLFFNKYINMSICQKDYTNIDYEEFTIFSCYDNKKFNFEDFPSLTFNMKSENLFFEFTYKDLFKKIDDKYYFLVVFKNYDVGSWTIGKPFYLKYTLVYNGESKAIGFYSKLNFNKEEQKSEIILFELNVFKIVIIILLLLTFIFLIMISFYYLGKKMNLTKRRKANELDDNYDYYSNSDKYKLYKKDINEKNNNDSKEQFLELSSKSN